MNQTNTYFANLAPDDLATELSSKIDGYYQFINRYGFLDRWRRSYLTYFGQSEMGASTDRLNQAGQNGELYALKVNHYRSILQNLLVLITQNPPALAPKATNTDSKSFNQTILAKAVLDYYMAEAGLSNKLAKAAELSLYAGEGFVCQTWNATAGQVYAVGENGAPIYDGDLEVRVFHPLDVIRETNTNGVENKTPWYITRDWVNKYDLAAKYPELANDIISITKTSDHLSSYTTIVTDLADPDYIPLYSFYHEESEALPNGRMFTFLSPNVWLSDGPLAYKRLPIYRMSPGNWDGTCFGYTVAYDLLGLQKSYDSLMSIVTTGQLNYGTQNIVAERGSELNVQALAQGLNLIEVNPGAKPPQALNLLQTSSEIFNQMNNVLKQMETISGINSTARGNPEESLKSGTALALVAAQALQFNSGLQRSYSNLLQDVGTGLIEILQEYALTPRIAAIAGKSNRSRIQEFKGTDLDGIARVVCESVNPISQTAAGRLQMAQDLLQIPGMIKTPQHYMEVIETGTFQPLVEHEVSQMLLIRSENEDLSDGKKVSALVTDAHVLHIKEHATVLDSPEARANPGLVQLSTAHIMEHVNLLKTTDPQLLMVLGQQPLSPPPGQPSGQPPQGLPQGPLQPSPHGIPALANPTPAIQQQAQRVQPAQLPKLPKGTPPGLQLSYDKLKGNIQR